MKRRLISVLMLGFFSVLLVGCDLFGGVTTAATTTAEGTGTYFNVVFFDGDESILETQTVLEGEGAITPATPTKAATAQYTYTFNNWDVVFTSVTADMLINPIFTESINQYTVTFYDEDGTTVLGTSIVPYGTEATAPANPTKADDATYSYAFSGWDVDFSNITANLSVKATYTVASTGYVVTFYDSDGSVIEEVAVENGDGAVAPANPSMAPTAEFTYTFDSWDVDFSNVTTDLTVTAVYTTVTNQYTVTFYEEDGTTLIGTSTIDYGTGAVAPAIPAKAGTAEFTYAANGWSGDFTNVMADMDVSAVYTATTNQYTVTFYDYDGTTLLATEMVEYGTAAMAPASPFKDSDIVNAYSFNGWDVDFSNVMADLVVNATFEAVPLGTTYTVNFFDADGMMIDTQMIPHGGAAMAPMAPMKATDEMGTYMFSGWDTEFLNVQSNLDIYPMFDANLVQHTVVFYDYDESVIATIMVDHGSAAIPPADPTRTADVDYSYAFIGWDVPFNNVTFDMEIYAVYFETSLESFNHDLLVVMMEDLFNPDDVEAEILTWMGAMGVVTEEALYDDLMIAQQLIMELQFIDSAVSFQDWYARTKALGFDKDKLINVLYTSAVGGVTNDLGYLTDELDYIENHITELEQYIVDNEAALVQLVTDVEDYCALQAVSTECLMYFDGLVEIHDLQETYYNLYYPSENNPMFNMGTYYNLEYYLDNYVYFTYADIDTDMADQYLSYLDASIANLTVEELAIYQPLLDAYEAWITANYTFNYADWGVIDVVDNGGMYTIMEILNSYFWGQWIDDDTQIYGYIDYLGDNDYYNWQIEYANMDLENLGSDLASTQAFVTYLTDPTGELEVRALMGTAYDALDAVVMLIDEDLYDLVMSVMMMQFTDSGFVLGMMMESESPLGRFEEFLQPEKIVLYADMISSYLGAAWGTMDQADYDNIKAAALGYLDIMLTEKGMDPVDEDYLLANIGNAIDRYLGYLDLTVPLVVGKIDGIDLEKAEAIMQIASMDFFDGTSEIDIAIKLTQILDVLVDDDEMFFVDIYQFIIMIYFDVTEEFDADPLVVGQIQLLAGQFLVETFALADLIKDFNPTYVSPDDIHTILELFANVQFLGELFDMGFEHINDLPVTVYEDWLFDDFLYMLLDESNPIEAIAMFMDVFDSINPEETYFMLRSMVQYALGLTKLNDFAGLQEWVGNLETFGFTQPELIGYGITLLKHALTEATMVDDWQLVEEARLLAILEEWEAEAQFNMNQLDAIDGVIEASALALAPEFQQTALDYWEAFLGLNDLFNRYMTAQGNLEMMIGPNAVEEFNAALLVISTIDNPSDLTQIAAEAAFAAASADYPDYQDEIDEFRTLYFEYNNFYINVFVPLDDIIRVETTAVVFWALCNDNLSIYNTYMGDYMMSLDMMANYQMFIDDLYGEFEIYFIIQDFLMDPVSETMTESTIGIILDDIQNMFATMAPDSFAMIPKLVEMFTKFDREPDMYYMDDYYDPYDPMYPDNPEEFMPFEIPFSAEEIYGLFQDASMFLELRGESLSPQDILDLEAYITLVITTYVDTMDMDPVDAADMVIMINDVLMKYIGFADVALTEVTDLLVSLTVPEIQSIMDLITAVVNGEGNPLEYILKGSGIIDQVFADPSIDIYIILDMYLELHMDINYDFNYEPADLVALQDAWGDFFDEAFLHIAVVADLDPMALDPSVLHMIFEVEQIVSSFEMLFDYPEGILEGITIGYSHDDFVGLCYDIFDDVDSMTVEQRILDLMDVFGLSEEETYYVILSIGSLIYEMSSIQSVQDIQRIYEGIAMLGFDNEAIAEIGMNAVMLFVYPNLLLDMNVTDLEAELADYEMYLQDYLDDYMLNEADILQEIGLFDDPVLEFDLIALWESFVAYKTAEALFSYVSMTTYDPDWDWDVWYTMQGFIDSENFSELDNLAYNQPDEVRYMYYQMIDLYNEYLSAEYNYSQMYMSFNITYPDLETISYSGLMINFIDEQNWLDYILQGICQSEDDIAHVENLILDAEAGNWLLNAIDQFLGDPTNVALTEDVLVILLDEAEGLLYNVDLENILMFVMQMDGKELFMLSPVEISEQIMNAGAILNSVFSTIDLTDQLVLELFADTVIEIIIENTTDLVDPLEIAAFQAAATLILDNYFTDFFDVPGYIGNFLLSFDPAKTQAVLDQVALLNMEPTGDSAVDEYIQVIAVSNLITILVGDESLDYGNLADLGIGFVFDVQVLMGFVPGETSAQVLLTTLFMVDQIILEAEAVGMIDVDTITLDQILAIQDLMEAVDTFEMYLKASLGFMPSV